MLVMAYGEYRLSRNIDFLCPYGPAFSRLQNVVYDRGYDALFTAEFQRVRPQFDIIKGR